LAEWNQDDALGRGQGGGWEQFKRRAAGKLLKPGQMVEVPAIRSVSFEQGLFK
jgi:hypothetical protein